MAKKKSASKPAAQNVRRTRRSSDDIMSKIVKAAASQFKQFGYAGATTATIARKADVTEAQLFRYFDSKSNLFRETIFEPLDGHLQRFIRDHASDAGDQSTNLYTSELQRFIRENSKMLISLVVAQTYDAGTEHGLAQIDSLSTYFEHGAASMRSRIEGEAAVAPELMVRLAFAFVLGSVMFRDWIFPSKLASDADIEAAVNAFVQKGLSANNRPS